MVVITGARKQKSGNRLQRLDVKHDTLDNETGTRGGWGDPTPAGGGGSNPCAV